MDLMDATLMLASESAAHPTGASPGAGPAAGDRLAAALGSPPPTAVLFKTRPSCAGEMVA
jgi:hypothetical protein